jgi:thiol-disulfide isomerase/thioredoxin
MKLNPKYFNLFIAVCAVITFVVILFGTMSYHSNQEKILRDNIAETDLEQVIFQYITDNDSLTLLELKGEPVLIDFWATWSGKAQNTHRIINELQQHHPDLIVIAAAVRDDEQLVQDYIGNHDFGFTYVVGTEFYHKLQVPGVPSQIMIDKEGRFFDFQIGENREELERKVKLLMEK